jgi:hypothetical protein
MRMKNGIRMKPLDLRAHGAKRDFSFYTHTPETPGMW